MTIEERFEKLEKELTKTKRHNRWLQAVIGLVVMGLGLIWLLTKTTATAANEIITAKVIRANKFIVEDASGNGPSLSVIEDGSVLELFNKDGEIRARLVVGKYGPMLGLLKENGHVIWSAP